MPSDETIIGAWWESSVVGVAIVAEDGTFLRANPALCRFLQYTESELEKRRFQDITHPDDVGDDVEMARDVADSRVEGYDMAKRYLTKRGAVVWANVRVVALVDGAGGFMAFLSQVSPASPVEEPVFRPAPKRSFSWVKEYWVQITVVVGAVATIASQVIEHLRKD
jgi:PAS domain S-box-containing protein